MWPMLLDLSKKECKTELRKLELDAYSIVVSTFRAQGNLNPSKIQLLKELETFFKISCDRSKAEMRRACNDEKLFTIAKKLSRGECVTSEWIVQSKRMIPMLPRLQQTKTSSAPSYYRILADHIIKNSRPILKLYSSPSDTSLRPSLVRVKEEPHELPSLVKPSDGLKKPNQKFNKKKVKPDAENVNNQDDSKIDRHTEPSDKNNVLYLANGYAVSSNFVEIKKHEPSEFVREHETSRPDDENHFLKNLIQKYKKQKEEKERLEQLFIQKCQKSVSEPIEPKKPIEPTESTKTVKNSRLISQMIETKNSALPAAATTNKKETESFNHKQEATKTHHKASLTTGTSAVKLTPSAQIIRLDSTMYTSMPSSSSISLSLNNANTISNNISMPTSLQMNSSQTISTNNTQSNASTIVKLNPPQPLVNNSNNSNNNIIQAGSSFGQLLNLNNQNLKHFVLPKINQKLIILPSTNGSNNNTNNSLNQATSIKKNYLINSNSSTINSNSSNSNIRIITQENGDKLNNNSQLRIIPAQNGNGPQAQTSSLQKVILSYKSTPNQLANFMKLPSHRPNESISNLDDKQVKVLQIKTEFDLTSSNSVDTSNESCVRLVSESALLDSKETATHSSGEHPIYNENTNSNSSDKFEKNFKRKLSTTHEETIDIVKQKIIRLDNMNNSNNTSSESPSSSSSSSSSTLSESPAEKNTYDTCLDDLNSDLKVFKDNCVV